jgi:hypothetical protein
MLETFEKKISKNYDSCVVEIPKEFALANGFPEKCFVSLTMRNGKLNSEIVEYNDQDEKDVDEFINDFPTFNEELKSFIPKSRRVKTAKFQ